MRKIIVLLLFCALLTTVICATDLKLVPEPIRVAVIDSGISTAAIDPARIAEGCNYIRPGDGTDDRVGHGTAVAGIIVGSESAGLPGVCPDAVLVSLVYASADESGKPVKGDTAMAAQAIYDAVDVYGCRIVNISSGSEEGSDALRDAVSYAEKKGVLVVSSAGNSGGEGVCYPGQYDSVLCVGSANRSLTDAAKFSQQGKVDLLAPGEMLRVATIRGRSIYANGTSFSTAYVSGAAAALLTADPGLTPAQVRQILCDTALDLGKPGYDTACGYGLLQLDAALEAVGSTR